MKRSLFFLLIVACFESIALDIKDYNSMKTSSAKELCSYLGGVSSGFIWAEYMERKGNEKQQKFCMDKQITLNCLNHIDLVDKEIKSWRASNITAPMVSDDSPIEPTFYRVLRKVYECK